MGSILPSLDDSQFKNQNDDEEDDEKLENASLMSRFMPFTRYFTQNRYINMFVVVFYFY